MPQNDGSIKIRIGAALDRTVDAAFGQFEKRAQRAGKEVAKALNPGGAGASGGPFKQLAGEADKASQAIVKSWEKQKRELDRIAKEQDRIHERSMREQVKQQEKAAQERARIEQKANREIERSVRDAVRTAEREAQKAAAAQSRAIENFAQRTSYRATRFLFPPPSGIIGSAKTLANDVLRGAGVDFNLGAGVARGVELQKLATQLSNQGYMPGEKGPASQVVAPTTLMQEARQVGNAQAFAPAEVLQAMTRFVDLTGDLASARQEMGNIAALAGATGSDLTQTAEAAAGVTAQLKEAKIPADHLGAVMRAIAGQVKIGAIELKDVARQFSAIAAVAPKFQGNVDENIEKLSALAQMSRRSGGSKSAAQATTAVSAFANVFSTPARTKAFKAAGIDVFADKGHTILKDPYELIKESLAATGGDQVKLNKLYASTMARRAVTPLTTAFNQAGGGKAGLEAVDAKIEEFAKASMSAANVARNNEERLKTEAAKAQIFQNNLDTIAATMAEKLLPAMEKLAPVALDAANSFGKLVSWAAENPGKAIVAAIVASIARAGLESAFRTAIERAIGGATGTPGVGGGAGRIGYGGIGASKGTGFTAAGAIGAVGMGAAIGIPVAMGIYSSGVSEYGSNNEKLSALMKGLSGKHGSDLAQGINDYSVELSKLEKDRGFFDSTFGYSDAEFKGARELLERKKKELMIGGGRSAAVSAPGLDTAQPSMPTKVDVDPIQITRGFRDALNGAPVLSVKVVNGFPTVGGEGREQPPGQRVP